MRTEDEIVKETAQFDRATVRVRDVQCFIQDKLTADTETDHDKESRLPFIYIYWKTFRTSLKDAIEIAVYWNDSELTIDEVLTEIRKRNEATNL